ncbi:uncharacterized protein LOC116166357 [Photinus pyralis]|uniref:uncharacterized protein LOC116166357 n=1 Tax=Photinus pyralis TaxID=7054 RepID=UPI0012671DE5|nr:uncharacterized protein LOC116166357 [Photinus pyralis]
MSTPISQQQSQEDSWSSEDDDEFLSTSANKDEQGKETLIAAWSLFLDGGIILEVGSLLEGNFFNSVVQISHPSSSCYKDLQYLQFECSEWNEIFSFKTEHLIRQMLQYTPKGRSKHEIFIEPEIILETEEEEEGENDRCIRISHSGRSILFSKKAIEMIFTASEVITQKLNFGNRYTMYCLYDDFTRALAEILHTENVTDKQKDSILSRGKFICKNLKLLASLSAWKDRYDNLQEFTVLTEIVNIHPQKFINMVVSKMKFLK